jgi:hypothetical protein
MFGVVLASRVDGDSTLLQEPFCIDVTRSNLGRLQGMLKVAIERVAEKKESDDVKYWSESFTVIALLRILKVQVQRLVVSGVPPQSLALSLPGVTLPIVEELKEKHADQKAVEDDSDALSLSFDINALRDLLWIIVKNEGIVTAPALHSEAKPLVISESQALLVAGLELFYPTADSRIALVSSFRLHYLSFMFLTSHHGCFG